MILVVDDDDDVREILADLLDYLGYRPVLSRDGAEALRQLQSGALAPSVILLDVVMPNIDGFTFRREQLATPALAGIPTVITSAARLTARDLADLAPSVFLRKPFGCHDLGKALRAATRVDQ